jgi:hypothetical protein
MGSLRNDEELVQLAQSLYTSALQKSRPHIQQVIENSQHSAKLKAKLEYILLLAIAFLAFEVRIRSINGGKIVPFLTTISSS